MLEIAGKVNCAILVFLLPQQMLKHAFYWPSDQTRFRGKASILYSAAGKFYSIWFQYLLYNPASVDGIPTCRMPSIEGEAYAQSVPSYHTVVLLLVRTLLANAAIVTDLIPQ